MGQKGKTRTGKNDQAIAEKRRQALELRKAGYGFDDIARALGYANAGGAYKAVQQALKDTYREPAEDVRKLELERLDRMMRGVWQRAIGGDGESIDRVLRLMQRRAKYLGIDISKGEVAVSTTDGLTVIFQKSEGGGPVSDAGGPGQDRGGGGEVG